MNWAALIWLGLLIACLVVEAATVTLVSLWFAAGALCAMAVSLIGFSTGVQVTVFFAVSILALLSLRPLARKHFTPRLTATNLDAIPGSEALVTKAINNLASVGEVTLNGMTWTARSTDGATIPEGSVVKVDRIQGVKLYVSTVKEPAAAGRPANGSPAQAKDTAHPDCARL